MNKGSLSLLKAVAYFKCYKTRCTDCALHFEDNIKVEDAEQAQCLGNLAYSVLVRVEDRLEAEAQEKQRLLDLEAIEASPITQAFLNMSVDLDIHEDD